MPPLWGLLCLFLGGVDVPWDRRQATRGGFWENLQGLYTVASFSCLLTISDKRSPGFWNYLLAKSFFIRCSWKPWGWGTYFMTPYFQGKWWLSLTVICWRGWLCWQKPVFLCSVSRATVQEAHKEDGSVSYPQRFHDYWVCDQNKPVIILKTKAPL